MSGEEQEPPNPIERFLRIPMQIYPEIQAQEAAIASPFPFQAAPLSSPATAAVRPEEEGSAISLEEEVSLENGGSLEEDDTTAENGPLEDNNEKADPDGSQHGALDYHQPPHDHESTPIELAIIASQPAATPASSNWRENISIPMEEEDEVQAWQADDSEDASTQCCGKCGSWFCDWSCHCRSNCSPGNHAEERKERIRGKQREITDDIASDICTQLEDGVDTATCCESFADMCCQTWSCDCINPCHNCSERESELKDEQASQG